MEYIPGETLEKISISRGAYITERLARIISELVTVTGIGDGTPGPPIGDGMLKGYLFGNNGTEDIIGSVELLNR